MNGLADHVAVLDFAPGRAARAICRAMAVPVMARLPPSLTDIEALAKRALTELPSHFKDHLGPVVIRVDEFPDAETETAMRLDSPFDLLGLYRGVALPLKSVSDPRPAIDMIFLYRQPILAYWCESGDDLFAIVQHVLIHEIGHHFGFSDDDMERIEDPG